MKWCVVAEFAGNTHSSPEATDAILECVENFRSSPSVPESKSSSSIHPS